MGCLGEGLYVNGNCMPVRFTALEPLATAGEREKRCDNSTHYRESNSWPHAVASWRCCCTTCLFARCRVSRVGRVRCLLRTDSYRSRRHLVDVIAGRHRRRRRNDLRVAQRPFSAAAVDPRARHALACEPSVSARVVTVSHSISVSLSLKFGIDR